MWNFSFEFWTKDYQHFQKNYSLNKLIIYSKNVRGEFQQEDITTGHTPWVPSINNLES